MKNLGTLMGTLYNALAYNTVAHSACWEAPDTLHIVIDADTADKIRVAVLSEVRACSLELLPVCTCEYSAQVALDDGCAIVV